MTRSAGRLATVNVQTAPRSAITARFVSVREFAQLINVSERQAWRLVNDGVVRRVEVSERCIRIPREDVDAYVQRLLEHAS